MQFVYLVNDARALEPEQTTTLLAHRTRARDHSTWVLGVEDLLCLASGGVAGKARRVPFGVELERLPEALSTVEPERVELDRVDVLVLRTNPGRDPQRSWAHEVALDLAHMLQERGVVVLNDPRAIRYCGTKLFLHSLPASLRPRQLISCDPATLEAFVREAPGLTVLKPLKGTWGQDVYRVGPRDSNLQALTVALTRRGYAVAQDYLPEITEGDVRLLLLDGKPLVMDGRVACVRRLPPPDEFRSNVHLGGTPTRVPELTPALEQVASQIGPRLDDLGICLAGLDVVGGRVIEINVYAPGGVGDASLFQGVDFVDRVLDAFEARF